MTFTVGAIGLGAGTLVYYIMQLSMFPIVAKALVFTLFLAFSRFSFKQDLEELEFYAASFSFMYIMMVFTEHSAAFYWMGLMLIPSCEVTWDREMIWSFMCTGLYKLVTA
jgi:hypothetical protein